MMATIIAVIVMMLMVVDDHNYDDNNYLTTHFYLWITLLGNTHHRATNTNNMSHNAFILEH